GLDLGASVAPADQRVEDLPSDERARPLEGRPRIEGRGHAGSADSQLATHDLGGERRPLPERRRGRERRRNQERHQDRHERSQNGRAATEHRRGHLRLYTWNPLFTPLVSRAGRSTMGGYRTCSALEQGGADEWHAWHGSHTDGEKHRKFNVSTGG